MDTINLSVVRQTFANTVFTHKVQEVACEFQEKNSSVVKIINLFLVLIVLTMLVLQAYNPSNLFYSYFGAGITIIEIIFLITQLNFNFEQKAILHKNSALKFMGLRDEYRSLIADIINQGCSAREIIIKRDQLQNKYQTICSFSPQTSRKEYQEAQRRLNKRGMIESEDFTWSDEEIDRFLPKILRLKK